MGWPVVTVASGGMPVTDVTATTGRGTPVTEATNKFGSPVTKVASGGMAVVYETIGGGSGGAALATLDGTKSAAIVLSNGNLTATLNPNVGNTGVASSLFKTTGKFYFETTAGPTHSSDGPGVITTGVDFAGMVTSGVASLIVYTFGQTWSNGGASGKPIGALVQNDVVGHAYDLAARKGWVRKNGGLWNGLAAGSEDPVAGLGGIALPPTLGLAPAVAFGGGAQLVNDAWTFNFGQSAFVTAAPAGFGNWTS